MGVRSNIDIEPILVSAETRMVNILVDSYAGAAERNVAEMIASTVETDGAEVKIRSYEMVTNFKTSDREDDVEFADLDPGTVISVAPTFKHTGLRVGRSELADMGGEGAEKMAEWSRTVAAAAGAHTGRKAIEILKANPTAEWDGLNLFATNHPTGYNSITFSNAHVQANLYSGTLDQANTAFATVLALINSIPTKAGYATRFGELLWLVPSAFAWRARQLTAAGFLPASNGTLDNTVNAGYGIRVVEVPELGQKFTGVAADDTTSYLACAPLSGHAGLIVVDRQGLEVQMHGPSTSAELNRKSSFEYVARFRNEVIAGRASHIHRISAA